MRKLVKDLARQRAVILYREAVKSVKEGRYELARRQVDLALRLLRKVRAKKPLVYRLWVCRNCLIPLIPSVTCRVRVRGNRKYIIVTKTCLLCGWVMRRPCLKSRVEG